MTALADLIRAEIEAAGPMSTARYMELCLSHPDHGYYATRDPFGAAGDFTTAPEISQMFGEMLGIWVVQAWQGLGRPALRLIELGPGRGTLMADMLRVVEPAGVAVEVWLVETSPRLREAQADRIPGARWAERLQDIPDGPQIIVANEFLDALPVQQHLRTPRGLCEHQIGLEDGALVWGLGPPAAVPSRGASAAWQEQSPIADRIVGAIKRRLDYAPGAALIIDYGYTSADRPAGFTLQAVRGHKKVDPFDRPGESDLTWLIDFDRLCMHLGAGAGIQEQGAFLAGLGIGQRAEALAAARPGKAAEIAGQLERLTAPDQMGTLFKVATRVSDGRSME